MLAPGINIRLAADRRAVLQFGANCCLCQRDRQDMPGGIQQFLRILNGEQQITIINILQTFENEIPQAMSPYPATERRSPLTTAALKTAHKYLAPQGPIARQGHQ